MTALLEGRTGLVLGVANKRSLAWACARALHGAGMRLALTYAGERLERSVRGLAADLGDAPVFPCDVTVPAQVDELFARLGDELGGLDSVLHAIAFAKREELEGEYLQTSLEGWRLAQEISAYSLTQIARGAAPLMEGRDGSIVTLTYLGGERVVPSYNVMGVAKAALEASVRYLANDLGPRGIRVNAISAGPVRTLSASAVAGFNTILDHIEARAPLRRNITAEDVAGACTFLCSPLASGVTGSTVYVDAGYHVMGV